MWSSPHTEMKLLSFSDSLLLRTPSHVLLMTFDLRLFGRRPFLTTEYERNSQHTHFGQNCGRMLKKGLFSLRSLGMCIYKYVTFLICLLQRLKTNKNALRSVQFEAHRLMMTSGSAVNWELKSFTYFSPSSESLSCMCASHCWSSRVCLNAEGRIEAVMSWFWYVNPIAIPSIPFLKLEFDSSEIQRGEFFLKSAAWPQSENGDRDSTASRLLLHFSQEEFKATSNRVSLRGSKVSWRCGATVQKTGSLILTCWLFNEIMSLLY